MEEAQWASAQREVDSIVQDKNLMSDSNAAEIVKMFIKHKQQSLAEKQRHERRFQVVEADVQQQGERIQGNTEAAEKLQAQIQQQGEQIQGNQEDMENLKAENQHLRTRLDNVETRLENNETRLTGEFAGFFENEQTRRVSVFFTVIMSLLCASFASNLRGVKKYEKTHQNQLCPTMVPNPRRPTLIAGKI